MTSSQEPRRLLVLGKTGSGKSSLGNALLNSEQFQVSSGMSSSSSSSSCQLGQNENVKVVDSANVVELVEDAEAAAALLAPAFDFCESFHSLLLLLRLDVRMTQEELLVLQVYERLFGHDFWDSVVIVFTHVDCFGNDEEKVRTCLQQSRQQVELLDRMLRLCGERWVMLDCGRQCDRQLLRVQVEQVMQAASRTQAYGSEQWRRVRQWRSEQQRSRISDGGAPTWWRSVLERLLERVPMALCLLSECPFARESARLLLLLLLLLLQLLDWDGMQRVESIRAGVWAELCRICGSVPVLQSLATRCSALMSYLS